MVQKEIGANIPDEKTRLINCVIIHKYLLPFPGGDHFVGQGTYFEKKQNTSIQKFNRSLGSFTSQPAPDGPDVL
jgi:hypothetical protein